ncbi:hypothetical protein H2278_00935 [Campylobacter sp. W0018]|nr:hypothetical protein [Campylobacter sp. W0014]MBZ7953417.1 hypothetical protein [Campylobacter sp. W0018]
MNKEKINEENIDQIYENNQKKEWDICKNFEEWIKTQPDKEKALKEFYQKCGIKY